MSEKKGRGTEQDRALEREALWLNAFYHFHPCESHFQFYTFGIRLLVVNRHHFEWSSCLHTSHLRLEPGIRMKDELRKDFYVKQFTSQSWAAADKTVPREARHSDSL